MLTLLSPTEEFELARSIAMEAHDGAMYGDKPYVYHPLAVAENARKDGYPLDVQTCAVLHDVVEDSEYTLLQLLDQGIPLHIVEGVAAVTYINNPSLSTEENGRQKIFKARTNIIGHVTKKEDSTHNRDSNRKEGNSRGLAKARHDVAKYNGFLAMLQPGLPSPEEIEDYVQRERSKQQRLLESRDQVLELEFQMRIDALEAA